MAETTIPQADDLAKVRRLIAEADARGSLQAAGEAVSLEPRHVGYYAAAAEALRLARRRGEGIEILPLGRQLLATAPRTEGEASIFRKAIESSPVVSRVAGDLLAFATPAKGDLVARIRSVAGLAASTASRRADTLLRWRRTVLAQERQGVLPAASSAVQYSGRAVLRVVRIESFKAFGMAPSGGKRSPAAIPLAPLTVLVGPNGAGKSTILQALDILGALVRGTISEMLESHDWEYADLPHLRSATPTITIGVELALGASIVSWELTLGTRKHPGVAAEVVRARGRDDASWRTLLERKGRHVSVLHEPTGERISPPLLTLPQSWLATLDANAKEDARLFPGLLALKDWAENIHAFWSLSPSTLRAPSRGATDHVRSHGGDLASFLFRLKRNRPRRFTTFARRVARHYPRLVQIEPKSGQYGWKYLEITERWNGEKATFNARQVSDGLLRLMAVASIPEWERPPSLVLLDEIENGLHPRLIGGIADLLAEVSTATQVIVTTHSPITLNYVPPESARVVTRGRGGGVMVTPLTETKNYAKLRQHFEPGELWYNAGEDRLVGRGRA